MSDASLAPSVDVETFPRRPVPEKVSLDGIEDRWNEAWTREGTYAFDRSATRRAGVGSHGPCAPYRRRGGGSSTRPGGTAARAHRGRLHGDGRTPRGRPGGRRRARPPEVGAHGTVRGCRGRGGAGVCARDRRRSVAEQAR
ncbi:hypothetical protein [Georgenia sp. SUBG003]|uniref:hypothetical protein n=1 Tax=Georgenia sp. SUBG003 TaxID=1497974 RepID=UPI003AB8AB21